MMLLGGFYVRNLPDWLIWCKYLSVICTCFFVMS